MTKSRKNKSYKNKSRKHKHTNNTNCKKCKISTMKGGSCGSCNNVALNLKGGNGFYKNASPIPGPFVGQPWGAHIKDWPGVQGIGGETNYLAYNNYKVDPQTAMTLNGGKKKRNYKSKKNSKSKRNGKSNKKKRNGGGVLPQDLVNLGSSFSYGLGSTYNALNGYPAPINPLPYKDQLTNSKNFNI